MKPGMECSCASTVRCHFQSNKIVSQKSGTTLADNSTFDGKALFLLFLFVMEKLEFVLHLFYVSDFYEPWSNN